MSSHFEFAWIFIIVYNILTVACFLGFPISGVMKKACFDYCGHIFCGNWVLLYIFGALSYVLVTAKSIENWVQMKIYLHLTFQYIVQSPYNLRKLYAPRFSDAHTTTKFFQFWNLSLFPPNASPKNRYCTTPENPYVSSKFLTAGIKFPLITLSLQKTS